MVLHISRLPAVTAPSRWAAPPGVALAVKQGWERAEPLVRRRVHISQAAHDNGCLVPAQGQACDHTQYVMRREGGRSRGRGREGGGGGEGGGSFSGIIAHRANRFLMTRSGCGLLLRTRSFSVAWPPRSRV